MMIKQDENGKQLIVDVPENRLSSIREVIYGSGKTLKEKQEDQKADQKKRIDE